jgi:hydroxymethylglutaryl-CoA lyase
MMEQIMGIRTPSETVSLVEVGTRDGFQGLDYQIPTAEKVQAVNLLSHTGLKNIEVSSFSHPKWIPQLQDALDVYGQIDQVSDVKYTFLIPNMRGLDRAIEAGVKDVVYVVAVSDGLNRSNLNRSTDEALAEAQEVSAKAVEAGLRIRGAASAAFGCPFDGDISPEQVLRVLIAFREAGMSSFYLADTIGAANPLQVRYLMNYILDALPEADIACHFHNTLGLGIANVFAAWEAGVTQFESSIAGLGRCPYAPGAPGNVATEELVYLFSKLGVDTGVDLQQIINCADSIKAIVSKHDPHTFSSRDRGHNP